MHLSPPEPRSGTPQPYSAFARRFTQPPGKLYLLHGEDTAFHLSHTIASTALSRGMRIAVADGGNWFNIHAIINFARAAQCNPDELLRQLFVSRSFTCYQMEQTITQLLPGFLKSIHSNAAFLFGLLDTLYDEQAPFREVQHILRRILAALQAMKSNGVSFLVTCLDRSIVPKERNQLFATLAGAMDHVYRLEYDDRQRPLLVLEHRSTTPGTSVPTLNAPQGARRTQLTAL